LNGLDINIGEWYQNEMHGIAKCTVNDYQGQFKHGKREGYGTEKYSNGTVFIGQF
jgi:hypothetical protein